MKTCPKCGEVKALSEFNKDAISKDGKQFWCKKCHSASWKIWYLKNAERKRDREAKRRAENPERARARFAKWCADNPEARVRATRLRAENLTDGYVADVMRIKVKDCPPELIELKRYQLEMHRMTKQLAKEIQNGTK